MSKTIKHKGKAYRIIQPGEHFDGKHLYDAAGKRVKGPVIDAVKAESLAAKLKKKKGSK